MLRKYKPTSPGRRHRVDLVRNEITRKGPEKSLTRSMKKKAGRSKGQITVRHQGGGVKRRYRIIDFKRDKRDIEAEVAEIEYDPNRNVSIALLVYKDGERRYILWPKGLKQGDTVIAGKKTELKPGNAMPIGNIPTGILVHNVELQPGRGGQIARGAGTSVRIAAKEGKYVLVKMPSGETRKILKTCYATIGVLGSADWKNIKLGKAGRKRLMGIRPTVRGVVQHPGSHPHGGGEGRSGIGMPAPKTPWGKRFKGVKTRRRKHTDVFIVKRRKK